MWIKQLIGRLSGQVVDLPFSAAENVIANGTGVLATEEEIVAAGFDPVPVAAPERTDILPLGYRAEPTEIGGFDLYDAAGLPVNVEPIPNMIAAIEVANDHRDATVLPISVFPVGQLPPSPSLVRITTENYSFDPVAGGFDVFDPAGLRISAEPVTDEGAARALVLQHLAASTGRTVEQVEADERDAPPVIEIDVPSTWRELHWSQRKALAVRIGNGAPVATAAEADTIIEEYLTRP